MRNLKFIPTAAVIFIIISCADLDLSPLSEGSSNNWYHDDTEYLMSLNDLMRAEFILSIPIRGTMMFLVEIPKRRLKMVI